MNKLATDKPIDWFEQQPDQHGAAALSRRAARRVYPGFLQLDGVHEHEPRPPPRRRSASCSDDLVNGETDKADATKTFYDEYFAVLDLPAEFYLETVRLRVPGVRAAAGQARRGAGRRSIRRRSAARRCSPSKASATTSARSARRWPRTTCAPGLRPYLQDALRAGRRRPLRRVQRQALERQHLPGRAGNDPDDRLTPSGAIAEVVLPAAGPSRGRLASRLGAANAWRSVNYFAREPVRVEAKAFGHQHAGVARDHREQPAEREVAFEALCELIGAEPGGAARSRGPVPRRRSRRSAGRSGARSAGCARPVPRRADRLRARRRTRHRSGRLPTMPRLPRDPLASHNECLRRRATTPWPAASPVTTRRSRTRGTLRGAASGIRPT